MTEEETAKAVNDGPIDLQMKVYAIEAIARAASTLAQVNTANSDQLLNDLIDFGIGVLKAPTTVNGA